MPRKNKIYTYDLYICSQNKNYNKLSHTTLLPWIKLDLLMMALKFFVTHVRTVEQSSQLTDEENTLSE